MQTFDQNNGPTPEATKQTLNSSSQKQQNCQRNTIWNWLSSKEKIFSIKGLGWCMLLVEPVLTNQSS